MTRTRSRLRRPPAFALRPSREGFCRENTSVTPTTLGGLYELLVGLRRESEEDELDSRLGRRELVDP